MIKEINEKTTLCLISYDLRAPEAWESKYGLWLDVNMLSNIQLSKLNSFLNNQDFRNFLQTEEITHKIFWRKFPTIAREYDEFIGNLYHVIGNWWLSIDDEYFTEPKDKEAIMNELFSSFRGSKPVVMRRLSTDANETLYFEIRDRSLLKFDKVDNPLCDPAKRKTCNKVTLRGLFSSCRKILSGELSSRFRFLQKSLYLLPIEDTYAPNSTDSNNRLFFDPNKDRALYEYEIDTSAANIRDRNIFHLHNGAVRDPRDGETFEEILVASLMPPYQIAFDYMTRIVKLPNGDSTWEMKPRFKKHKYKLLQGLLDGLLVIRMTPADTQSAFDVARAFEKSVLSGNRQEDLPYNNLFAELGFILKKWDEKKYRNRDMFERIFNASKTRYKTLVDNSYFVSHMNDESLGKAMIAVNQFRQAKNKGPINKDQVRSELNRMGWYYTIPNRTFYADKTQRDLWKENPTIESIRKQIEALINKGDQILATT